MITLKSQVETKLVEVVRCYLVLARCGWRNQMSFWIDWAPAGLAGKARAPG